MKHLFSLMVIILLVASCSKEHKKKCWMLYDFAGNEMGTVCDKTAAEMAASFPDPCSYHEAGGASSCWMVNNNFIKNKTEKYIEHYVRCYAGGTATTVKVPCDYCNKWYSRYKRTYKPTSQVTYSSIKLEQLCGDTSKALYHGRQILIKDTPDSLVVLQVSINGTF